MPCLDYLKIQEIVNKVSTYKSRRMRILEALRLLLETLTTANGYSKDISEASFNVNGWQTRLEGDTPVIYVVDDGTPAIERMAGRQRQYKWRVLLFGVCKGYDIVEFEEFLADIQECVEINGALGGIVSKTEVNNISTDSQLFSEKEDTHLFEIELQIEYVQCHGDPR